MYVCVCLICIYVKRVFLDTYVSAFVYVCMCVYVCLCAYIYVLNVCIRLFVYRHTPYACMFTYKYVRYMESTLAISNL